MFGITKTTTVQNNSGGIIPSNNSHALNTIVAGTSIQGDIKSDNDIRIDGTLHGNLDCAAKIIIGPHGSITGEINCINAVIEGKFDGNLTAKETLSVKETAIVTGTVNVNKLSIHSGASWNVECKMPNEGNLPPTNGISKNGSSQIKKIVKHTKERTADVK